MDNKNRESSSRSLKSGTPMDYSEDLYRVHFELIDYYGTAKEVILNYLGDARADLLSEVSYGFEVLLPIQTVPDIVRELTKKDIAIFQIVRGDKTNRVWR